MSKRLEQRWHRNLGAASLFVLLTAAALPQVDPFLWLEDIRSAASLDWVTLHNQSTTSQLEALPNYSRMESEARTILTAKDRIPGIRKIGSLVYNFWQDADHPQGILRRTRFQDYESSTDPQWEIVLDLDALSQTEGKRWVYKGLECLAPKCRSSLVTLSDGGKDAVVVREFDLNTKSFLPDGFSTPEGKSTLTWVSDDLLAIGADFGPGSMTDSGYPRQIRLWKRGTPLAEATLIFEGKREDVGVSVSSLLSQSLVLITRRLDFFRQELYAVNSAGVVIPWSFPQDLQLLGISKTWAYFSKRTDWSLPSGEFARAGSLIAMPWSFSTGPKLNEASLAWEPTTSTSLQGIAVTRDEAVINVREHVLSRALRLRHVSGSNPSWSLEPLALPNNGLLSFSSIWESSNEGILAYQDFLTPPSTFLVDFSTLAVRKLKSTPERFDSSGLTTSQLFATSSDGTKIPYFVVHPRRLTMDGSHPTILTGYGGFMIPMTPYYLGSIGKLWLERGGIYVVANIRGGGEYGPAWHEAARREKRQVAFNDFYAVAEDLIARGFTSPSHLGIEGGSNGGLLVGTAFTQRPDLFHAVVCSAPLLDMLRFHRLLAGASWMGEYGNPDDPKDRAFLEKYSPYQNVTKGKAYPEIFFTGSTADDRVHPGHARKMAAKLESLGYPVLFYENTEGGHSGAANLEQRIRIQALQMSHFADELGLP